MVKAGDSIPDVQVHAGSSVPHKAVSAQRERDVVARGLRHEPTMLRATNVARTAKRWFQRRASPGRNETLLSET